MSLGKGIVKINNEQEVKNMLKDGNEAKVVEIYLVSLQSTKILPCDALDPPPNEHANTEGCRRLDLIKEGRAKMRKPRNITRMICFSMQVKMQFGHKLRKPWHTILDKIYLLLV